MDVSWSIKKTDRWRLDAFELWYWRRLLKVPWTARRSNQSILKEISTEYSLEGLMLKLKLQKLWPPDAKNWLIWKDPDSGKDWRQEKGMTENEMVGWPHWIHAHAAAAAKSLQSCPTLCDPIDGSPPGSSVPGILQARTLEGVAISFSKAWKWKVKVKSLSRVQLLATPWTVAYQAPPSMRFPRQEYWSGVPLPSLLNHSRGLKIRSFKVFALSRKKYKYQSILVFDKLMTHVVLLE